jgi:hypothetical protein
MISSHGAGREEVKRVREVGRERAGDQTIIVGCMVRLLPRLQLRPPLEKGVRSVLENK